MVLVEAKVIDFHLKCCIVEQKCKNNITGRKRWKVGLQLPPTNVVPSVILEGEDYDLKASINDRNKGRAITSTKRHGPIPRRLD